MYHPQDFCQRKLFFCVTGCSLIFTERLVAYGGASEFLKGIYCPYDEASSRELIVGYNPPGLYNPDMKMVSEEAVKKLATATKQFFELNDDVAVIAVTASLYKDGQREDRQNRAFLDVFMDGQHFTSNMEFNSKMSTRFTQESDLQAKILRFAQQGIWSISGED